MWTLFKNVKNTSPADVLTKSLNKAFQKCRQYNYLLNIWMGGLCHVKTQSNKYFLLEK